MEARVQGIGHKFPSLTSLSVYELHEVFSIVNNGAYCPRSATIFFERLLIEKVFTITLVDDIMNCWGAFFLI